jgi:predicted MPP superfamily phosphohydrolase
MMPSRPSIPTATPARTQCADGPGWHATLRRPALGPSLHFWSIEGFEFNHLTLALDGISPALAGLRILHIADLHLRARWPKGLDRLIEIVQANPPDLILYGGDQAHNMHHLAPSLSHIERLIKSLPARRGAYAILGNHDGDLLGPRMESWGARVIVHQRIDIAIADAFIELIGFPGPAREDIEEEMGRRWPARRPGIPRIVLSHYPDLIHFARGLKPDLYLAGHTHGGQICLPGEHPILRHDSLRRKYCHGVHNYEDICLFVSRGMGFSSPLQLRAFCPCEVMEIQVGCGSPHHPDP